ncbi:ADP-ribosylation factor-like protein 6-interacting protein 4 [Cydia pomonella]|uniref:ADP-ribosylation factor-like protein 6-interacting protein 4 n=1 Tax=Cydia pomonella TaxID=82600 RepID=UPI002ADDCD2F|nr:ADP-ribosylation factor-like protein 6-interacting protein 4 [Cydia pomonella]XP_061705228.1 ADP-ribosylation factor-like protein 6-interacting protein 4 [Cydia pomonella]
MGKEKSKKRRRSSSSSSSSSGSDSSQEKKKLRKLKKKLKKEQKKTEKMLKKKLKEEKRKMKKKQRSKSRSRETSTSKQDAAADIPIELMEKSKAMAPMTKEEWEQKQSIVRRVLDEESGRYRLIKGDGEVLEEIVSRDRHRQINRQATQADGAYFQANTVDRKI